MENSLDTSWRQTLLPTLSLFTSVATLLCCALPALLVALGLGASLAGLVNAAPWITALSEYKPLIFAAAGVFILVAAAVLWRARHAPCPADPVQARACARLRRLSWVLLGIAAGVYLIGFFFAFVAAELFF